VVEKCRALSATAFAKILQRIAYDGRVDDHRSLIVTLLLRISSDMVTEMNGSVYIFAVRKTTVNY
jgi:hypothetical protein